MTITAIESGFISSERGQLLLFVTFLINIIVQIYRERRQRKWDLADRAEARQRLDAHEKNMTKKVDEQTETIKAKVDTQTDTLQQSMRTRVSDFNKAIDGLLTNDKRRKDD